MVYVSGPKVGSLFQVRLADPLDDAKMPGCGIIIKKNGATECFVQLGGNVTGVFTTLEPGKTYKVGEDGEIIRVTPIPGILGYSMVQFVGIALSADVLNFGTDGYMARRKA